MVRLQRRRFLLQSGLILAPVLALTLFSLWSLRHERLQVKATWQVEAERLVAQSRGHLIGEWIDLRANAKQTGPTEPLVYRRGELISPQRYPRVPVRKGDLTSKLPPELRSTAALLERGGQLPPQSVAELLERADAGSAWLIYKASVHWAEERWEKEASNAIEWLLEQPRLGMSETGLPLAVLAHARRYEEDAIYRKPNPIALRRTILANPSILTEPLLRLTDRKVSEPKRDWERWKRAENARHIAASWGPPRKPRFDSIEWNDQTWVIATDEEGEGLESVLVPKRAAMASWSGLQERFRSPSMGLTVCPMRLAGRSLDHDYGSEVLAVDTVGPWQIGAFLTDPGPMNETLRQRNLWAGSLILVAAFVAVLGVLNSWLTLRREQRLSDLKTNFVSAVSHELRTPIASISLMADSLQRGRVQTVSKLEQYYRLMGQECRRLGNLIENVLDVSRIEQVRKEWRLEESDVVQLVDDTVEIMEPAAKQRDVALALTIDSSAKDLEPEIDAAAIRQCLVNLIDNALKHAPPKSTVQVILTKCDKRPNSFQLVVRDQGPGISRKERKRVFEPFYRVGSELTRQQQGTGIGLSIVKHIVDAHGGDVRISSAAGNGCRIILTLPIHHHHEQE